MKTLTIRFGRMLICTVLVIALALCSLAVFAEEAETEDSDNGMVTVVRLTKDAPMGTRLTADHMEEVSVPSFNLPANLIKDIEEAMIKYMVEDAFAGEYLNVEQISEKYVAPVKSDLVLRDIKRSGNDYVIVSDYIKPDTGDDVAALVQELIDTNPNRCIYFPAGEYIFGSPVNTSSNPNDSVSILLDDGAVIKASDKWKADGDNALICLGGSEMVNNIRDVGSYYSISGGTLDANGKANGLAISAGRETVIRNLCIKNAKIGISIPRGTNNVSADVDFEDVTIIGQGKAGTIGIDVHAHDNTYSNVRIYDMATGMNNTFGGEVKSIYVINTEKSAAIADQTFGFVGTSPRMTQCYTENCATAYAMSTGAVLNDCTAVWTSASWKVQKAFNKAKGNTVISGCRVDFLPGEGVTCELISDVVNSGKMLVKGCIFDKNALTAPLKEELLFTPVVYAE